MAPNGMPILSPPANALPPGMEWQATQSEARAKYSSPPTGGATLSAARDAPLAHSRIRLQKAVFETIATFLNSRGMPAPCVLGPLGQAAIGPPRARTVSAMPIR